jgi:hypothetical protein
MLRARSIGSPKWALRRETAGSRITWESLMRRAPRRGAIVFENNIRELQTPVDGPGSPPGRSHAFPELQRDALDTSREEAA